MQALGLIETKGLIPAIECADVMLKTAQVELVERTFVGSGLVTITVTGDVGAVKASVEAGATAVKRINPLSLISQHVIPRPHPDVEGILGGKENTTEEPPMPEPPQDEPGLAQKPVQTTENPEQMPKHFNKEAFDAFVEEFGLEKTITVLKMLPVVKLRNLAREYKELDIAGRAISKAKKDLLVKKLAAHYQKETNK
ncbi:BMC domain-containing protein [Peptococcaceae bacterium 1198_IL3148]